MSSGFSLQVHAAAGKRHVGFLRRHLRAAHRTLNPPLAELSVALVGDARMSALHEQFMGIPGPTDVLTFPLDVDARGRALSGEVVVCVPEAGRRARETGTAVERELLLYALHGLLHLCGYDDRTEPDYRRMHRREDMILTQLGVGPVFEGAPVSRPGTIKTPGSRDATRRASGSSTVPQRPQGRRATSRASGPSTARDGKRAARCVAAKGARR